MWRNVFTEVYADTTAAAVHITEATPLTGDGFGTFPLCRKATTFTFTPSPTPPPPPCNSSCAAPNFRNSTNGPFASAHVQPLELEHCCRLLCQVRSGHGVQCIRVGALRIHEGPPDVLSHEGEWHYRPEEQAWPDVRRMAVFALVCNAAAKDRHSGGLARVRPAGGTVAPHHTAIRHPRSTGRGWGAWSSIRQRAGSAAAQRSPAAQWAAHAQMGKEVGNVKRGRQ
jgi:hypothetical protein